ncbi:MULTISPECIES: DUF6482 family protein [unclassified Agarivorans]|uniref:DUF6482 family protein n=1 Tax=unclassified Agarivorans TaxID=2636026 RepID=UPI0026E1EA10|nr:MULTISPECIES: DUF6482 family protein [unclassified Agarivorans]MDO6684952.1 DUF6482 family protein [Agarivorans sp. 3_MG-2023]MDO6714887.1 DUF6482 family protein [Agarivorans sp. 2_MG-2023]
MELVINSHEGDIYLVCEQNLNPAQNKSHPKRFNSLSSVKQHYQQQHPDKVWLIHHSAYDEMCGLPSSHSEMKIELDWSKH